MLGDLIQCTVTSKVFHFVDTPALKLEFFLKPFGFGLGSGWTQAVLNPGPGTKEARHWNWIFFNQLESLWAQAEPKYEKNSVVLRADRKLMHGYWTFWAVLYNLSLVLKIFLIPVRIVRDFLYHGSCTDHQQNKLYANQRNAHRCIKCKHIVLLS